ncbi:hypothetical protein E2C01_006463 [Portunus trituberculatus]|uniref:Uncharacterized protein n=1 Tax=Portunus trituberculatus TaxID=210409 RepID=A0A5B7CWC8_PORTR|nr:hypothetical protein [Portunus trituberculatus]
MYTAAPPRLVRERLFGGAGDDSGRVVRGARGSAMGKEEESISRSDSGCGGGQTGRMVHFPACTVAAVAAAPDLYILNGFHTGRKLWVLI